MHTCIHTCINSTVGNLEASGEEGSMRTSPIYVCMFMSICVCILFSQTHIRCSIIHARIHKPIHIHLRGSEIWRLQGRKGLCGPHLYMYVCICVHVCVYICFSQIHICYTYTQARKTIHIHVRGSEILRFQGRKDLCRPHLCMYVCICR